ncbi:hypothetical protein [Mycoplana sp. MJR14]|uniref:hypothetical protein n=1 Tax=Mycoplana sp. MJR14 TaxID=3032583 RepID=UPI0023DA1B14|nr:hypothetical protein [Mycoplana sp. MJR14]MDF1632102.1 hypothetical protein [Mycoplana sp. MJR14]
MPFRLITKDQQFKKWQWIKAKVEKARSDHRPESYNIKIDTIEIGEVVPTTREWADRRRLLGQIRLFDHFDEIEAEQKAGRLSLALLKPTRVVSLDIVPVADPNWTAEELAKLEREQQSGLFDTSDKPATQMLEKLPFDFYYRYECGSSSNRKQFRHKLVDWEVGALFRTCSARYGNSWETPFRKKLEDVIPAADLMLLMGNQHRFQNQWLIISLIYPPHQKQKELF